MKRPVQMAFVIRSFPSCESAIKCTIRAFFSSVQTARIPTCLQCIENVLRDIIEFSINCTHLLQTTYSVTAFRICSTLPVINKGNQEMHVRLQLIL
jgi:hypothetical protein